MGCLNSKTEGEGSDNAVSGLGCYTSLSPPSPVRSYRVVDKLSSHNRTWHSLTYNV